MIRLDYFDEAIGIIEGFSIFEDLLKCGRMNLFAIFATYSCTPIGELKSTILGYDITTLLERKLGAGKPREMRTSLIYLNIFRIRTFSPLLSSGGGCQTCPDGEHSLTRNLVERGMSRLRTRRWRTQQAGVAILCSLAKTCLYYIAFWFHERV